MAQLAKNLPEMQETQKLVQPLGWEDPLEEDMATQSSILAWKVPRTEEPDRLQSMGWQSHTRLSKQTHTHTHTCTHMHTHTHTHTCSWPQCPWFRPLMPLPGHVPKIDEQNHALSGKMLNSWLKPEMISWLRRHMWIPIYYTWSWPLRETLVNIGKDTDTCIYRYRYESDFLKCFLSIFIMFCAPNIE